MYANDPSYSGYLDPATNNPLGTSHAATSYDGRVVLTERMYFDWSTRCFVFPVTDSQTEVMCTVGDGMVVNGPVTIASANQSLQVFRNGNNYLGELSEISEPGDYVVSVHQNGDDKRLFGFTIVGDTTGGLYYFTAPDGFYITAVTIDGNRVDNERYVLDLASEGQYDVSYECFTTDIGYSFRTTIDRTPPEVEITGKADDDGRFHSEVTLNGLAWDDTVVLLRNGQSVETERNGDASVTVRDSGNYVLRVFDAAGNVSEQDFTIMVYFNVSSLIFFTLVILTTGGVAAYILSKRRNLKIG